jgi:hypothetical protein
MFPGARVPTAPLCVDPVAERTPRGRRASRRTRGRTDERAAKRRAPERRRAGPGRARRRTTFRCTGPRPAGQPGTDQGAPLHQPPTQPAARREPRPPARRPSGPGRDAARAVGRGARWPPLPRGREERRRIARRCGETRWDRRTSAQPRSPEWSPGRLERAVEAPRQCRPRCRCRGPPHPWRRGWRGCRRPRRGGPATGVHG